MKFRTIGSSATLSRSTSRSCVPMAHGVIGVATSALLVLYSRPIIADERPHLDAGNVDAIEIRDCIMSAARAANEENLDAYTVCFERRLQARVRQRIGLLFVQHNIAMEVIDSHLLKKTGGSGELAIKYRATLSEDTREVVSLVTLTKEDGSWKIGNEKIHTISEPAGMSATSRPLESGGHQQFQFGVGGVVNLNPNDDLLPRDIGRRRGGCANGRCGL